MRLEIKATDFNFDYTGSTYTSKSGFKKMTGKELKNAIVNKRFWGDYPMGFKFITDIYENGKAEGVNHLGSQDFGDWIIDMEVHTLSLNWNNGWINTVTFAYKVNGNIEFYDVDTGNWRTTFKKWENWEKE